MKKKTSAFNINKKNYFSLKQSLSNFNLSMEDSNGRFRGTRSIAARETAAREETSEINLKGVRSEAHLQKNRRENSSEVVEFTETNIFGTPHRRLE